MEISRFKAINGHQEIETFCIQTRVHLFIWDILSQASRVEFQSQLKWPFLNKSSHNSKAQRFLSIRLFDRKIFMT